MSPRATSGPFTLPTGPGGFQHFTTAGGGIPGGGGSSFWGGLAQWGIGQAQGWIEGQLSGGSSETPSGSPSVPGFVGGDGPCPDGTWSVLGKCINKPGGQLTGGGVFIGGGEAVLGLYGAAMAPMVESRAHRRCRPGMVLAKDGLCYNRSQLRKADRAHVPPRKPLLTGGDLNAISKASRAARALERQTKRLQSLGMLKKPTRRAAPARKKKC